MCGNKIVVALGLLLATAYARPDGYGVKGGNPRRAAAQSSATASAFASAIGTSNAAASAEATANSFGYGGNIGKAISSATAIANANPIEGSDDLGQSNDREKDTEYKTVNHQDGTSAWNQHIANADHDGLGNNENSASGTIDVNKSATVCHTGDLKCRNLKNKPSVSNPHPTYNERPDLSGGSSEPLPNLDGGWGGNTGNSGRRPCNSGNTKISGIQPGGSDMDQSYQEHVQVPADNEHTDTGKTDNPGSRPCTSGSPKCSGSQPGDSNPDQSQVDFPVGSEKPVNKPSVSNPYPTYNEHPDLSAGSSQPLPKLDGSWGGNSAKPGSRPCTSGNPKCSGSQPGYSNLDQSHVDFPADSEKPVNKPSVSNPYPTYNEHPDLPAGSSQQFPKPDGGWGGHIQPSKPSGTIDGVKVGHQHNQSPSVSNPDSKHHEVPKSRPCTSSGSAQCSSNKPTVSNTHPTEQKSPDSSSDLSRPLPELGHSCGGNTAKPGSRPCNSGTSLGNPGNSNPFLNGEIKVSDIQKAVKSGGSSTSAIKPNSSNPFLNPHNGHVKPPTDIHHTGKPSGNDQAGSSHPYPDETKPNPSNPFLNPHDGHVQPPTGIHHTGKPSGKDQEGSSHQYPDETKPNPSNPFLNPHDGHIQPPTGIHHTGKPSGNEKPGSSNQYPESKPNPSNPFLNPHDGHIQTPTGIQHTGKPSGNEKSGSPNQYPETKPNPSNPFLNPHSEHASTNKKNPGGSNESGNSRQYPKQQNSAVPSTSHHGQVDNVACSLASCKNNAHNSDIDIDHSVTDKFESSSTPSYGVKAHRAGVKGGSVRTPENSRFSKYDDSGNGNKALVNSNAYSQAHVVASSSAGGESSAHAKSQAYSNADASGSSSWSSSSASASASAFSSSWH